MFQRWYELNFQVTNTSPDVCQMSFNSLLLQEENSNHAPYQAAGPGRDNYVTLQAKQSVPTSPYFPQAPLKGRFDLQQVGLRVTCPRVGTVIMSYNNVVGIGR